MILKKRMPNDYLEWNKTWHAPYGRESIKNHIPKRCHSNFFIAKLIGMFGFQPNSDSRILEYPWAYYSSHLTPGMTALDIGGGFSGFPFFLSSIGINTYLVDPFVKYGNFEHYNISPAKAIDRMNKIFNTSVNLKHATLDLANFQDKTFERVFCISVIEHMPIEQSKRILIEVERILKPDGLFLLTVDLFLNLVPFSDKETNQFGMNISIKDLIAGSGLELVSGLKNELYGFSEFKAKEILANLENYYLGFYPVLTQAIVLKKSKKDNCNENFIRF